MGRLQTIGRKLKSVFVVGLIFFSGVVVGGILSGAAVMRDITTKAFGGSGPSQVRKLLVQHAKDGLGLDEDQQKLFTQILNETGQELNVATKPAQPQIVQILDRTELRLRNVLRTEQTARFDGWAKKARERWAASANETSP